MYVRPCGRIASLGCLGFLSSLVLIKELHFNIKLGVCAKRQNPEILTQIEAELNYLN